MASSEGRQSRGEARTTYTHAKQKPGTMAGLGGRGARPLESVTRRRARQGCSLFEPFSAQSQHLGRFDLTLFQLGRGQALEDVDKDGESAI